jgi:hypothetical protein
MRSKPGQFVQVQVQGHAMDTVHRQLQRRNPTVESRPVVLQPGGNLQGLRLDVHRDLQQLFGRVVLPLPLG